MLLQIKSLLEVNSQKIKKKVHSFDFYQHLSSLENNARVGKI